MTAARLSVFEPNALVVDASVGIKLFIDEKGSELVEKYFLLLTASPPISIFVPDLFYVECANIIWKYTRRYDYPIASARENIADLQLLSLQSVPTSILIADALEMAYTFHITAYDACYVSLAVKLDLPLLTADNELVNKLKFAPVNIINFLSMLS